MSIQKQELYNIIESLPEELSSKVMEYIEYLKFASITDNAPEDLIIKDKDDLKKITVGEVTHSVFYTPQYVAHSLGYFEDEGLKVDIQLTSGADKVTSAVLSGDVEIGFCGSEATIYVYNNGEKDYLVNFAGLTKKDGSFLVSRENSLSLKNESALHIL